MCALRSAFKFAPKADGIFLAKIKWRKEIIKEMYIIAYIATLIYIEGIGKWYFHLADDPLLQYYSVVIHEQCVGALGLNTPVLCL